MLIYVDGKLVPKEEATVSVFDHGFLYGDGIFEGIRVYDGNVFRLDEHIARLRRPGILHRTGFSFCVRFPCATSSDTSVETTGGAGTKGPW